MPTITWKAKILPNTPISSIARPYKPSKASPLAQLSYWLAPEQLFGIIAKKGAYACILKELEASLNYIEQPTMGTESKEDFNGLFQDVDLAFNQ